MSGRVLNQRLLSISVRSLHSAAGSSFNHSTRGWRRWSETRLHQTCPPPQSKIHYPVSQYLYSLELLFLFPGDFNSKVDLPPLAAEETNLLNGDKGDEV